ncbi:MAG: hypothetical protein WD740_02150 [Anaerolineales bacterium]
MRLTTLELVFLPTKQQLEEERLRVTTTFLSAPYLMKSINEIMKLMLDILIYFSISICRKVPTNSLGDFA